jgi:DNA invertase Pin-like site-specific DNA recombinase
LLHIATDRGKTAKSMTRDGLQSALAELRAGKADVLMVSKSDRATRSVSDLYTLMDASAREGWSLVDLETDVDTTDPTGRMIAGMRGVVSQWEREIIGKRTKEALAQLKAQGVKLGAPVRVSAHSVGRVHQLRSSGLTLAQVAEQLNAESAPTPNGGRWSPTSVARILARSSRPSRNP